MIVRLGNSSRLNPIDKHPAVTVVHVPDADENGRGGYVHEPGAITPNDFRAKHHEALAFNDGITNMPESELILSVVNAWSAQGRGSPDWVECIPNLDQYTHRPHSKGGVLPGLTTEEAAKDVEKFLAKFWACDRGAPKNFEDLYWTTNGPPGEWLAPQPDPKALFTNDGRVMQAYNYGGGPVLGATGQATTVTATTMITQTTAPSLNCYIAQRVMAFVDSTHLAWAHILANTNGNNTTLTLDQWYQPGAPGGGPATTPPNNAQYAILATGPAPSYFVALGTNSITPQASDHALTGEYFVSGGTMNRKVATWTLTSGTSPASWTLTPVFTANSADAFPTTFYAVGAFSSAVRSNTTYSMRFENVLPTSLTIYSPGDQISVIWSETGS